MKKYLLDLIDNDLRLTEKAIQSAKGCIERWPDDAYFQRQLRAGENRKEKLGKYRNRLLAIEKI